MTGQYAVLTFHSDGYINDNGYKLFFSYVSRGKVTNAYELFDKWRIRTTVIPILQKMNYGYKRDIQLKELGAVGSWLLRSSSDRVVWSPVSHPKNVSNQIIFFIFLETTPTPTPNGMINIVTLGRSSDLELFTLKLQRQAVFILESYFSIIFIYRMSTRFLWRDSWLGMRLFNFHAHRDGERIILLFLYESTNRSKVNLNPLHWHCENAKKRRQACYQAHSARLLTIYRIIR